jgi:hypothetical protein
MPTHSGPNPSADNSIVFSYDTGDTSNSYIGEPTVNLLYSPGATNLINGAGDIYGRCTKTDLGNGKYKFVNNGTGFSTVRVYTNQSDLINGATYGCSVYFEDLIGSISIDWCDTGITGINSSTSPSGRLGGYGTRATYDGPYYFLDINFDSGGSVTLFNPQVEYKSHITPFVAGTRSATQGLLPLISNTSLNISTVSFNSNAQIVFDGTDDYINLVDFNIFNGTLPFSVELIFSITAFNGACILVSFIGENLLFYTFGDSLANEVLGFRGNINNTWITPVYTPPLNIGKYYHVNTTYSPISGFKLYLDGVNISSNSLVGSITSYSQQNSIGSLGDNTRFFNGQIPIVKIYNTALSADQVQQNYRQYKSRFNLS